MTSLCLHLRCSVQAVNCTRVDPAKNKAIDIPEQQLLRVFLPPGSAARRCAFFYLLCNLSLAFRPFLPSLSLCQSHDASRLARNYPTRRGAAARMYSTGCLLTVCAAVRVLY